LLLQTASDFSSKNTPNQGLPELNLQSAHFFRAALHGPYLAGAGIA
jgi:hypothetical protein